MAQTSLRNHDQKGNPQQYARMPLLNFQRYVVPIAVLTKSKLVPINAARPVTVAGNPQHALKDKGVIDSGCSRHITGNMSYLSNFEELNGGCVAFGGNPKGGKIFGKGKIRTGKLYFDDVYFVKELKFNLFSVSQMCDKKNSVLFTDNECLVLSPEFKLPDENQVLRRVHKENNMYNVNLKTIVPFGDLTYLFAKATLDDSNLWHRRLGHINFKTMNKLVKVDEGFLVGYSISSKAFRVFNSRTRILQETLHINFLKDKPNVAGSGPTWLFDIDILTKTMNYQPVTAGNQSNPSAGIQEQFNAERAGEEKKELEFEGRKPESEVNVSLSSSAQTKKHDDKTKREAKGKSPVESSTGYRNLSAEFEDFFDNSINEVNVVGSLVPAVGPTHGKSLYVDSSQLPDDPSMPELEDITYSDDEYDVGAQADFNNLETSITFNPIPTTRFHKDHPVTQIISDLSSATQTRSMTMVAKDQEPKRVHQALKDPSWIEAMQEELLQFQMQKSHGKIWSDPPIIHGIPPADKWAGKGSDKLEDALWAFRAAYKTPIGCTPYRLVY
nr:ribonuclease H-like domain-containing protein [Tanacetum cinerariifolium]